MTHSHIDSSGCFECPLGSACDMPNAGQQFDAMIETLKGCLEWMEVNYPKTNHNQAQRIADKPIFKLRDAIATAQGKRP
jgi:hypothetical protein